MRRLWRDQDAPFWQEWGQALKIGHVAPTTVEENQNRPPIRCRIRFGRKEVKHSDRCSLRLDR
jgi:hypothetical protein